VEQRRVEPAPVQFHRIGPGAGDVLGGDQEVLRIPVAAGEAGHIAVDEVELTVVVRQVWRPHPVGVAASAQIEQAPVGDDPTQAAPVHQITRVVHEDARIPLEGRRGQVVVVADAQDRRVRVEPGEDGIADRPGSGRHVSDVGRHEHSSGRAVWNFRKIVVPDRWKPCLR